MADSPRTRGVVLAGGDSERFGPADKALADLDGRPLVAHALDAVAGATDETPMLAVATAEEGDRLVRAVGRDVGSVTTVTDDPSLDGPLAGVVAAAGAADSAWLLVCGCDMPLVTEPVVRTLADRAAAGVDAVVPVVDGYDQPMLALYDRERVLDGATELGGRGPRALVDRLARVERVEASSVDAALARAVTNVNTRAELDAVRERTAERR